MPNGRDRRRRSTLKPSLIVVLIVICALCIGLASLGEDTKREFSFGADPGFELLKATYSGSMSGARLSYTLFADGRLEMKSGGRTVWESLEAQLSYEEVVALIRDAVDSGLMEYDEENVFRKMDYMPRLYSASDAGTLELVIQLPSYRGPGQDVAAARKTAIRFKSASSYAERFPDVAELQALVRLEKTLQEWKETARSNENEN